MEVPTANRVRAPLSARLTATLTLAGPVPSRVYVSWVTTRRRPGVAPRWKPWFRVSGA